MGVTEGAWRLKALLFIVFMMVCLYGTEAIFVSSDLSVGVPSATESYNITSQNLSNAEELQTGATGDIMSTITGIFAFATFTAPYDMPLWASFFLTIFSSCLIITLAYIIYTFAYEVIKGLPFT